MHRSSDVIHPKTKVSVELQRADGSVLEGHVYVGGQERVLDLMNNKDTFLPFEVTDGKVLFINKDAITMVVPYDKERMEAGYAPAPSMAPRARKPGERHPLDR